MSERVTHGAESVQELRPETQERYGLNAEKDRGRLGPFWKWLTTTPARHVCTRDCDPWDEDHYQPDRETRP